MQQASKLLFTFILMVGLVGCASNQPREENVVVEKINVCTQPPRADKVTPLLIEFRNIQDSDGIWWVAMEPRYYENMSINLKNMISHIEQKNAIIEYYKSCYEKNNKKKEGK